MELLEGRFARKKNSVSDHYKFRQQGQGQGNSIDSFVSNSREFANFCDFGQKYDEMIRNQSIEKTNSKKIRESLFVEETLTSKYNGSESRSSLRGLKYNYRSYHGQFYRHGECYFSTEVGQTG